MLTSVTVVDQRFSVRSVALFLRLFHAGIAMNNVTMRPIQMTKSAVGIPLLPQIAAEDVIPNMRAVVATSGAPTRGRSGPVSESALTPCMGSLPAFLLNQMGGGQRVVDERSDTHTLPIVESGVRIVNRVGGADATGNAGYGATEGAAGCPKIRLVVSII
ncbi:hypothetical protein [Microbacterium protaetiae]|uniref:hypothetical protein n=1 Tax=Microbacterium protaetiae TaxID=2509458 RepID=UPI0013EC6385|nr:hypothetical protein [Microbacterium protaetiae]